MIREDVLHGSPHVAWSPTNGGRVTRVPVRRLWSWHRKGVHVETLLKRYPQLGPAAVLDALAFAYDNPELIEADLAREQALLKTDEVEPVPGAMRQTGFEFK